MNIADLKYFLLLTTHGEIRKLFKIFSLFTLTNVTHPDYQYEEVFEEIGVKSPLLKVKRKALVRAYVETLAIAKAHFAANQS